MCVRLQYFFNELKPVAEVNNIILFAHPDDPPVKNMRETARLFYRTEEYEKLLNLYDSPSNGFELCMGTIQEMEGSNLLDFLDKYSR